MTVWERRDLSDDIVRIVEVILDDGGDVFERNISIIEGGVE